MTDSRVPARAIWGLHNNRYDLAGHTPSLSDEDARQLRQVPDVGDPIAPVDDAVAHLHAPEWGCVVARYYTDSRNDSAGRLMWVYDVVRPSDEQIALANNNPFALLPPQSPRRTIDETGELAPRGVQVVDEPARLRDALHLASPMLESVLASVLSGRHTLWLTAPTDAPTIEAIVLLLPPERRALFTFQTYTLRKSDLAPRLVMAERLAGTLRDVEWTCVLPSDQRTIPDVARTVARSMIELANTPGAVQRAHELYASQLVDDAAEAGEVDLLTECARLVRFHQFDVAVDSGDARRALRVMSEATTDDDRNAFANALLINSDAQALGAIIAADDAHDDIGTRRALTMIARIVARRGDADAAFSIVPVIPQADAVDDGRGSELDVVVAALTTPGSLDLPAVTRIVTQCTALAPRITSRRAQLRFNALVLRAVRRALTNANSVRGRPAVLALHGALTRFWNESPAVGELDQALHAFVADADPRSAAAAARLLVSSDPPADAAEIAGWIALRLAERDDDGRRLRGVAEFLSATSMPPGLDGWLANLVGSVNASPSDYFNDCWGVVLDRVDGPTRVKLQVDAFVEIVRDAAKGAGIGVIANACSAMATRGVVLSEATVRAVIPALRDLLAKDRTPFVNFRLAASLVEQIADGPAIDRLHGDLWVAALDAESVTANLWRTATTQAIARNVLDASYLARLRTTAGARPSALESLPNGHKNTLMALLHHASAPFLGMMRRPAFAGRSKNGDAE